MPATERSLAPERRRTTSTLNDVNNDTGRIAFCGPFVISAVTGHSISKIEDEIRRYRDMDLERKARPTLWNWMQKPRNAWASYILAIHKGKEGHWILIKGVKMCDTFTEGRWQFVCDGPHRGCRIMEVFEVKRNRDI
jgi:hypothetical protein